MSRLVEWLKDTVNFLEPVEVILGAGIGVVIFCVLLLVVVFFALFGPIVIAALFALLLCIGMGVLIAGSL